MSYTKNPDVPSFLKKGYQKGKLSYEEFARKSQEALYYLDDIQENTNSLEEKLREIEEIKDEHIRLEDPFYSS